MVEFKKRSIKGKFKLSPESEFSRGIKIEIKLDKSCVLASKLNYDFVLPGQKLFMLFLFNEIKYCQTFSMLISFSYDENKHFSFNEISLLYF